MTDKSIQPIGESKVPAVISDVVDMTGWAASLVNGMAYEDPDPGYLNRKILLQTLKAATIEEVFADNEMLHMQDWVPDYPGAYVGPLEIDDLYVTGSDFGEGMPCYMIWGGTDLSQDMRFKVTTGATGLQGQTLRLISLGEWPIRCVVKRQPSKDKGGRHLLRMWPPN